MPAATINNFTAQWTGKVQITNAGYYTFYDASDDDSRVVIDGVVVAQDDRGGGTDRQHQRRRTISGSSVFLTAGLHDIAVQEVQGTGGWATVVNYTGADTGGVVQLLGNITGTVTSPTLFTPESSSVNGTSNAVNLGNNVTATGSATINLNGTSFSSVQIGTLTPAVGSVLTVNGEAQKLLRATATNLATAGVYTITNTPDVALGAVTDNGNAVTIVKQGTGKLIFDAAGSNGQSSLVSTSLIDIQAGTVVIKGMASGSNPVGQAQLKLDGGILNLDTQVGNVAYANAVRDQCGPGPTTA